MKRLVSLCFIIAVLATFTFAQPQTVTDYFMAFPTNQFAKNNDGKILQGAALTKFRRSLIKVEDTKNGYLRLEGAWEGWAEIALFKKADGSYLVAQTETGCGPACGGSIKFFTYNAGKWADVTKQVFPALSTTAVRQAFVAKKMNPADGTESYFLLPRVGTTIKMACNMCEIPNAAPGGEEDTTLLEFTWNGAKFARK